jgi:hypothetical protein
MVVITASKIAMRQRVAMSFLIFLLSLCRWPVREQTIP